MGNTLGGLTNYAIGRFFPHKLPNSKAGKMAFHILNKYGYITLLFSWLPLVGDPFCLIAGWLRFNFITSFVLIAIGKFIRYMVLVIAI